MSSPRPALLPPDDVVGAVGERARGRLSRWAARWGTATAVVTALFSSSVAAVFIDGHDSGTVSARAAVALLVGWVIAGGLVVRRRHPVVLTLVASGAALVLQLDTFVALLALTWVIASQRVRTALWCGAAATAATAVALARDLSRAPGDRVFAVHDEVTGALTSAPGPLSFWVAGVLLVAAAVGTGLVRRYRTEADSSYEARDHAVATLREQTARQDERELIAREVHDTVAHHIATIAMQASAFEVTQHDDAAKDAARQVRRSAQHAIAELRSLLTALRTGEGPGRDGASLGDLVALLDGLRERGLNVTGTVFVSDAEAASEVLARATFRIVQESLTNALKHAPGAVADVSVRAGRTVGVHVRVCNGLVPGLGPGPGTRSGLTGMGERATALGGTLRAGVVGNQFVVDARLPWSERALA
ncbi:hypothetical protein ET495_09535 [Xylanimonas allomyrinae]|uniref:histidine kinase n=1 Tax=Xylanimonas allomyrinae TaxID=2509459 RepID=A0A4P6ENY5_9MICO|nr:histidine kinase [Xylanimonas allomyrinae]QAY63453.1 hypothetical protein ET495_09535 [Xylanimonas allomyrinae]